MHRSSESVAAIATALAKAQTELCKSREGDGRDGLHQSVRQSAKLPLRLAVDRPGHRAQGLKGDSRSQLRRPPTLIGPTAWST
jgi:hypothetical protein